VNKNRKVANDFSQADYTWARSACCLRIKPGQTGSLPEVTLIVFSVGVGLELRGRLAALARNTSCQEVVEDPYYLFNIVSESLIARIDKIVGDLGAVFSQEESVRNDWKLVLLN